MEKDDGQIPWEIWGIEDAKNIDIFEGGGQHKISKFRPTKGIKFWRKGRVETNSNFHKISHNIILGKLSISRIYYFMTNNYAIVSLKTMYNSLIFMSL